MPKLDGTGPEGNGNKTGRRLGICSNTTSENENLLGRGQGKKHNSGGGNGKGRRLRTYQK